MSGSQLNNVIPIVTLRQINRVVSTRSPNVNEWDVSRSSPAWTAHPGLSSIQNLLEVPREDRAAARRAHDVGVIGEFGDLKSINSQIAVAAKIRIRNSEDVPEFVGEHVW